MKRPRLRDPLLRWAGHLLRLLSSSAADGDRAAHHDLFALCNACNALVRLQNSYALARARGWQHATGLLRSQLLTAALQTQQLSAAFCSLPQCDEKPPGAELSLAHLLEDLRQLTDEFEEVKFDLKLKVITATTPPIELQEVKLGRFAIELRLDRVPRDSSSFRCVALQPNPASTNDSVTHPHVSDKQLCAGEASVPIAAALEQGRICDAFCLVRSVLQHYNEGSPYVSLDDWDGTRCDDCGQTIPRDNSYYCEHCDKDYCDDCMSCCDCCDESCCRSCLDRDAEANVSCCPSCRKDCSECGRTVQSEDAERNTGLCPQCRREREELAEFDDEQEDNASASAQDPQEPQPEQNDEPEQQRQPGRDAPAAAPAGRDAVARAAGSEPASVIAAPTAAIGAVAA